MRLVPPSMAKHCATVITDARTDGLIKNMVVLGHRKLRYLGWFTAAGDKSWRSGFTSMLCCGRRI